MYFLPKPLLIKPLKLSTQGVLIACTLFSPVVLAACNVNSPATTPSSDFTDHNDGTVTHTTMGLMWKVCSEGQTWAAGACSVTPSTHHWQQALQIPEALNLGGGFPSSAPYTNWRLPNLKELKSIVEFQCYNPSINETIFPSTGRGYWSSSPYAFSSNDAWGVDFILGDSYVNRNYNLRVRLVRNALSENEAIVHNGVTYGTVTSPYTGRVWLDRNIGASKVCTAYDDTACYGDYYQWGRNTDGHEKPDSDTISIQATDVENVGHNNSIYSYYTYYDGGTHYVYDWASSIDDDGSLRSLSWSKTDGSNVCPVGYKVPNIDELKSEIIDINTTNIFSNFLKIPAAGDRRPSGGVVYQPGFNGGLWSSSQSVRDAQGFIFHVNNSVWFEQDRAYAYPVRCIKGEV